MRNRCWSRWFSFRSYEERRSLQGRFRALSPGLEGVFLLGYSLQCPSLFLGKIKSRRINCAGSRSIFCDCSWLSDFLLTQTLVGVKLTMTPGILLVVAFGGRKRTIQTTVRGIPFPLQYIQYAAKQFLFCCIVCMWRQSSPAVRGSKKYQYDGIARMIESGDLEDTNA